MLARSFFMLTLAFLGAFAAPAASTATVAGTVGPTVSETVITPYHRTDVLSTPCGHSLIRTTGIPVVPCGISTGVGFLGTTGVFPGIVGNGFTGTGVDVHPGVVPGGLLGNAGIGYQGLTGADVYPRVEGVGCATVLGGGAGVYPHANFL